MIRTRSGRDGRRRYQITGGPTRMTRGGLTICLCDKPGSAFDKGETFAARKRESLLSFIVVAAPTSASLLNFYTPVWQSTKAVPLQRAGVKGQRLARGVVHVVIEDALKQ